jgi:hypothetical protein
MIGRASWIILGVMATTTAMGAAMVLPMIGAHRQALAEQPRVQSLVDTVVSGEIAALTKHGGYQKIPFGASDPDIALNAEGRAAIIDYAIEARQITEDRFRVQAWPRPKALDHGSAAAVSYFVDLSTSGKILDQGWVGKDDTDE